MIQKQNGSYTQWTRLQWEYLRQVKISFTHQQLESCVDDECLHTSLKECQDRLKTWLIMQYGISKTAFTNMPVFCCLLLGVIHNSICIWYKPLKLPKYICEVPDSLKSIFATQQKLFIIYFWWFSSLFPVAKPSAIMADFSKLLWAQTSYITFLVVHLYLACMDC